MADIFARMNQIFDDMFWVHNHLKQNGFKALKNDLGFTSSFERLQGFFKLSASNTALFTCIFVTYFQTNEKPVNLTAVADSLETNPLRLLEFRSGFTALEDKGFITAEPSPEAQSLSKYYRIPEAVTDAICKENARKLEKVVSTKQTDHDLTYPEQITEKELFYMEEIREDVESLFTYFEESHFRDIQKRLAEKKMPKDVCVMLHGESGSGKTETVYQLAKKTNRAVYHLDIGATISPWVGGTEQKLSAIFEKYGRLCKRAGASGENIPILLFNEADALFGRRFEQPSQGSEVSENHIQAILLDYLENQSGILIVTTNIANNFDKAFERRFLFKIKFEKPNFEIKKKIWTSKAKWLQPQTIEHLAQSYALSGAEIENVVRKATMQEVLTGIRSSAQEIESYCKKEKIAASTRTMIGFNR